jgi:type 1 fimbria pilin
MKRSFHVRSPRPATRTTSSFLLTLLFIVLIFSLAGNAQQLTATLTGTVTDASGAVVPGATIVVHSEETNADIRSVGLEQQRGL